MLEAQARCHLLLQVVDSASIEVNRRQRRTKTGLMPASC
jgi:hypothetical protein